ncbi:unnamed protein product, partial [Polarella glacialis]
MLAWVSIRLQDVTAWQEKWASESQHGYRPQHGTEDVYWSLALRIECALLQGTPLTGVSFDYSKCFDRVPVAILLRLVTELGMDSRICAPVRTMYSNLRRRFRINGSVGDEFRTTNGILQGCPLSVLFLNALVAIWCKAIDKEVPLASPSAFADDTGVTASSRKEVQQAVSITEEFAELTGQQLNQKKSVSFSTSARRVRKLRLKSSTIPITTSWKSVGAHLCTNRGRQDSNHETKVQQACKTADRIRWLPLHFEARSSLACSLVVSGALFGCSVARPSRKQLSKLRTASLNCIWGSRHRRRCAEIVFTLFAPGHRADPEHACTYNTMRMMRRMLARRDDLHDLFRQVWTCADGQPRQDTGPVACIAAAASDLNWTWPDPLNFVLDDGSTISPLQMSAGEWEHVVRDGVRRAAWRRAAARREDMHGIEDGIDREMTLALLRSSSLPPYEKSVLRSILAGSVWTQDRLSRAGMVQAATCPYCDAGAAEDHEHMWWHCPAWEGIRQLHSVAEHADVPSWPACLAKCGILPEKMSLTPVIDLTSDQFDDARDSSRADALVKPLWKLFQNSESQSRPNFGKHPLMLRQPETASTDVSICDGRVVVHTDGASRNNQHKTLRRAGVGAFWGKRNPLNVSEPLVGPNQTNNRAELVAAIRVLELDSRPLNIRTDSQYVYLGCTKRLAAWSANEWRSGRREISNRDLWQKMQLLLERRETGSVLFTKVKAHASHVDVRRGCVLAEDKFGNDQADALAVAGAAIHPVDNAARSNAVRRMLVIRSTQRMMIEIVLERASRAKSRRQQQADDQAEEAEDQDDEEGAVQRQPQLSDGQPLGRASFGADREDDRFVYILMEPAEGGELLTVIKEIYEQRVHALSETWAARVFQQCLSAIAYCHERGILHKDLKSENIMLLSRDRVASPHVVIIDFGVSELLSTTRGPQGQTHRNRGSALAGTCTTMAPEVWTGDFGPKCDVWSLGCVLFEFLSGRPPFMARNHEDGSEWLRLHRAGPDWSKLARISGLAQQICQ